ncbi:hypothetical protein ACFZBU_43310 [Embleya sp. NPDC008237]|uniref:hypothetical protein n=1 Tax=Embleya sp. NPDC008237 TaxID=3363978 RepID=UPI0036E557BD
MPETSALDDVLRSAVRVRISSSISSSGGLIDGKIVVDLSDRAERDRLRVAMSVESPLQWRCMCGGDVRFEFFDADARHLTAVVLHHGAMLRWEGWAGDAVLTDGQGLLRWLHARGAPGPLRKAEEDELRRVQRKLEEERWLAAMPDALDDLSDRLLGLSRSPEIVSSGFLVELHDRVRQAIPDSTGRALALLAWHSGGTGRCSGYPVHEDVPSLLLKDLPIGDIIAALQDPRADARHHAGAVRHLVGWKTRHNQQSDIDAVPEALKARLLHSARTSGDEDKQGRAERWLAGRS